MPERRCTIDSSCVIALDLLSLLPKLSWLFSVVLVPKAVREELFRQLDRAERLSALFDKYGFLQRCDEYDQASVDVLLLDHNAKEGRDRGEAEAFAQAAPNGDWVIVDDPWGRSLARNGGLECHGTVWVLEQFHELGLLAAADLRSGFVSLRVFGLRLPWPAVNRLLQKIGQPQIELDLE